jgi:GAF domain-containing protein
MISSGRVRTAIMGENKSTRNGADDVAGKAVADMDRLTRTGAEGFMDLLLESTDLAGFLQRLAQVCAEELSGPDEVHCSVTVERERLKATLANSSSEAARMDELQYSCGEGPCQDALVTGQLVDIPDLLTDPRYPRYRKAMTGAGIRSVLGIPISVTAASHAIAALNCYAEGPNGFPEERRSKAQELARLASRSVLLAIRVAEQSDRTAELAAKVESVTAVSLAVGLIMARTGCTPDEAMEELRSASSDGEQELGDVASSLLTHFGRDDPKARLS